jgi:ABC-2 type transport system ATP-binding protein
MSEFILECSDLRKSYGKKQALCGINLTLPPGQIIGLLGPNGSGKTTLLKMINGLLTPTSGTLLIDGNSPGIETKKIVSYLPERTYLTDSMKVSECLNFFEDFFEDFRRNKAETMLSELNIDTDARLKTLSKGTKEKVQLILVMSRDAKLYCLDEPIAGVDPAARDYILRTIINNYNPEATVLISTHLISDIEQVLDEVVFIQNGQIILQKSVDDIRCEDGRSVDSLFREVFKC